MIDHTHLGAYGLIIRQDAVLLIRKARGPYTGAYDLPGGKIEFGESPLDAMRREIAEETGLRVQSATLIDGLSHQMSYQDNAGAWINLHHLGFLYHVIVEDDTAPLREGDGQDALGAEWIPIRQLDPTVLSPIAHTALQSAGLVNLHPSCG